MIIRQKQNRYPLLHAITVPAGLLLAVVFLAGCPASPPEAIVPPPPEPGVTDVSIRDFAFIPDEITIRAGRKRAMDQPGAHLDCSHVHQRGPWR